MRFFSLLLLAGSTSCVWAQGALQGMKDDVISSPTHASAPGSPPLLQLGLVVAVLFVLIKFVLPKVLLKFTNRLSPGLGSSIKVEESATIGTGGAYVVQVRGRTLLVGASSTGGLSLLCDLTSPEPEPEAFFEMLDHAVVEEPKVGKRLEEMLGR
ncbi:MAG: flagellar biosynthetic protein FliO [Fimbriimonadaceae bacterium]|nr:flagellar biosynthetic protein FliO [Fimbriimonadaceae bacterium]